MPYHFRKAQTDYDYHRIYALRFQTYCVEKRWLKSQCYPDRLEKDIYDPYSIHFLAESENGDIVGTVRLILSNKLPDGKPLPIAQHPNAAHAQAISDRCTEYNPFQLRYKYWIITRAQPKPSKASNL